MTGTRGVGTGRPARYDAPLAVPPSAWWALLASGLDLQRRRTGDGWRCLCPVLPDEHKLTLTNADRIFPGSQNRPLLLHCHGEDADYHADTSCSVDDVLAALGCARTGLYPQPADAADGPCLRCRQPAYRVAGLKDLLCLGHLLDHLGAPRSLIFAGQEERS